MTTLIREHYDFTMTLACGTEVGVRTDKHQSITAFYEVEGEIQEIDAGEMFSDADWREYMTLREEPTNKEGE